MFLSSLLAAVLEEDSDRNLARRERWAALSDREREERTWGLPRRSVHDPYQSSWAMAYFSQSEQALITLTGLNHHAFQKLHDAFAPLFHKFTPYSSDGTIVEVNPKEGRGRPRKITSHACLGLALMWTRTACQYWVLGQSFGLVATSVDLWLNFAKQILVHILKDREDSRIKLPIQEKVVQYKEAITTRYPALKNVAFVGDGVKILLQKAGDEKTQEAFYNGWKSGHYITNLFVFAPDGTIVMAMINCPGSMHDSELAAAGKSTPRST